MQVTLSELTTDDEFREAWLVMAQLRTQLSEEKYLALLAPMRAEGYRLLALRADGQIKALAGIILQTNLYDGRHIFVYDLVTDADARSKGYGQRLLERVEDLAQMEGCECVTLSSGVQRHDAHRFYEDRMGYTRPGHVFKKRFADC